jgi:hypothetical protein
MQLNITGVVPQLNWVFRMDQQLYRKLGKIEKKMKK